MFRNMSSQFQETVFGINIKMISLRMLICARSFSTYSWSFLLTVELFDLQFVEMLVRQTFCQTDFPTIRFHTKNHKGGGKRTKQQTLRGWPLGNRIWRPPKAASEVVTLGKLWESLRDLIRDMELDHIHQLRVLF